MSTKYLQIVQPPTLKIFVRTYTGPAVRFEIKWGQAYIWDGRNLTPLLEYLGLIYLIKARGNKSPLDPYVLPGLNT